jgi:hypothetical protein
MRNQIASVRRLMHALDPFVSCAENPFCGCRPSWPASTARASIPLSIGQIVMAMRPVMETRLPRARGDRLRPAIQCRRVSRDRPYPTAADQRGKVTLAHGLKISGRLPGSVLALFSNFFLYQTADRYEQSPLRTAALPKARAAANGSNLSQSLSIFSLRRSNV